MKGTNPTKKDAQTTESLADTQNRCAHTTRESSVLPGLALRICKWQSTPDIRSGDSAQSYRLTAEQLQDKRQTVVQVHTGAVLHDADWKETMTRGAPLVSVAMTAYNSAAWLPRSISSVFEQQTSFDFELVLGDDCSTDDTRAVLSAMQQRYGPRLRILPRSLKLGMQRNYFDVFEQCRGRFIAWLDADDYWTDGRKLELQVQALARDPSLSVCGHFVRHITSTGHVTEHCRPKMEAGRYGLADIIAGNFIPSTSIMFHNGLHRSLPPSFFELTGMVDWPILLQAARNGGILLLDRVMADYVLHPGSAYQGKGPLYQDGCDLEFYEWLAPTLPPQWQRSIRAARGMRHCAISYHLLRDGRIREGRQAAYRALCEPDVFDNVSTKLKSLASVESTAIRCRLQKMFLR